MASLAEVQEKALGLSDEERKSLLAWLVHSLPGAPLGPDDEEVKRREEELSSGTVTGLTHEEFLRELGRG